MGAALAGLNFFFSLCSGQCNAMISDHAKVPAAIDDKAPLYQECTPIYHSSLNEPLLSSCIVQEPCLLSVQSVKASQHDPMVLAQGRPIVTPGRHSKVSSPAGGASNRSSLTGAPEMLSPFSLHGTCGQWPKFRACLAVSESCKSIPSFRHFLFLHFSYLHLKGIYRLIYPLWSLL